MLPEFVSAPWLVGNEEVVQAPGDDPRWADAWAQDATVTRPSLTQLARRLDVLAREVASLGAVPTVDELTKRVAQCRAGLAAWRRYDFSPSLCRALATKILDLDVDVSASILAKTIGGRRG